MSKEAWGYEQETPETAFLAGVVDAYVDRLNLFCTSIFALDMDIFHVPDNDTSLLNDAVKKRLLYYHRRIGGDSVPEEKISRLTLRLKRREITGTFSGYYGGDDRITPEAQKKLAEADREGAWMLQRHLGKPLYLLEPERPDDALPILGNIYLGMGFYYYFVQYEREYAVLFLRMSRQKREKYERNHN